MSLFLFDAAKLQQQTAKTCQYLIEKQKKVHFFCTFLFLSVFFYQLLVCYGCLLYILLMVIGSTSHRLFALLCETYLPTLLVLVFEYLYHACVILV